jgi:hypothetical protein
MRFSSDAGTYAANAVPKNKHKVARKVPALSSSAHPATSWIDGPIYECLPHIATPECAAPSLRLCTMYRFRVATEWQQTKQFGR